MRYLFILILLASCSTNIFRLSDSEALQIANESPTCKDPKTCEIMWARAQNWLIKNSDMKIQVSTDNLIETYNANPRGGSGNIGVRISKEPKIDGSYSFKVETFCSTIMFCPSKFELHKSFNAALKEGF